MAWAAVAVSLFVAACIATFMEDDMEAIGYGIIGGVVFIVLFVIAFKMEG